MEGKRAKLGYLGKRNIVLAVSVIEILIIKNNSVVFLIGDLDRLVRRLLHASEVDENVCKHNNETNCRGNEGENAYGNTLFNKLFCLSSSSSFLGTPLFGEDCFLTGKRSCPCAGGLSASGTVLISVHYIFLVNIIIFV